LVRRESQAIKSDTEPIVRTTEVSINQSPINTDHVTACVALVGQLHRLLTAGNLSISST